MKRTLLLPLLLLLAAACRRTTQLQSPVAPPSEISASSLRGAVEVRWEDVPGATGYVVYASSSGDPAAARSFDALPPWTMELDTSFEWTFSVGIRGEPDRSSEVRARPLPRALFAAPIARTPTGIPARFGAALAIGDADGDGNADLLVGAPSLSMGGGGAALLFISSNGLPSLSPAWVTTGGYNYGGAVAIARDFNGDGRPDIAVGDPQGPGAFYIFLGNGTPFPTVPDGFDTGFGAIGLGATLDADADITNDGRTDLIVSAPFLNGSKGSIRLYIGDPFGINGPLYNYSPSSADDQTVLLGLHGASFGGDVNGDGRRDIVVGSDDAGTNVRLLPGGPILPAPGPSWSPGLNTGTPGGVGAITAVGDVNCDGYADIIARDQDFRLEDGSLAGALDIFFGSAFGPADQPDVVLPATGVSAVLGRPLAVADVDGDGCADIIIGASDLGYSSQTPELQVFLGSPSAATFATTPAFVFPSDLAAADWGFTIASGDLDGDGLSDIALGAPVAGTVELFFANPTRGPIVDAGPPQYLDAGGTATFPLAHFFDPIRTIDTCMWDWDDGTAPELLPCAAPSHVYAVAGTFHPLLTVTSGASRHGTARTRVQVDP